MLSSWMCISMRMRTAVDMLLKRLPSLKFEAFRLFSEISRPIQMLVITSDGTNRCKPTGIVTSFDIVEEVSKLPVRGQ